MSDKNRKPRVSDDIFRKLRVGTDNIPPSENDSLYWKRLYEIAEATNKRLELALKEKELAVKEKEMENKMLRDEIERLHTTIRAFSIPNLPAPDSPTVSPWNKKPGIPDYARYSGPIKMTRG